MGVRVAAFGVLVADRAGRCAGVLMTVGTLLGKGARAAAVLGCLIAGAAAQDRTPVTEASPRDPAVWGDPSAWGSDVDIQEKDRPDRCDPSRTQIHLIVSGIKSADGMVTAELYRNDQKGFLNKKGRLRRVRAPARVGSATFCVNVEPGVYAAVAYHDQDGDRDLDKKWNQMPKEPFGLSNDPELKFGFPDITDSLFAIGEAGGMVTIALVEA